MVRPSPNKVEHNQEQEDKSEEDDESEDVDDTTTPESPNSTFKLTLKSSSGLSPAADATFQLQTREERLKLASEHLDKKYIEFENEMQERMEMDQHAAFMLSEKRNAWNQKQELDLMYGDDPQSIRLAMRKRVEQKAAFIGQCWVFDGLEEDTRRAIGAALTVEIFSAG